MKTAFTPTLLAGAIGLAFASNAHALAIDLLEAGEDPITTLVPALLAPASGVTVVAGSESFVGRIGDGNLAQSATYSGLSLVSPTGKPTITNPDGIFLTSGVANVPFTNNDTSFDHGSVGIAPPGTGSDADLAAILTAAGAPSSTTNDTNYLEFSFTVDPGKTSVSAQFVFGSDEFPDQGVTDVFAFIVDDVNYAYFQDGSLVSFVTGVNADQFNDNNVGTGNYPLEYDGISNSLTVVGLLDPALAVHTLKIAIADTADSIYDSGVFIGNLLAGTGTGGGVNPAPEPTTLALLGLGLAGLGAARRRRA